MPRGSFTFRRWPAAVALAVLALAAFVSTARADEPGPETGTPADATVQDLGGRLDAAFSQMRPARSCQEMAASEVERDRYELVLTDADLIAQSDGSLFCLFFDHRWGSYEAVLLNQRSIEEFRRAKESLLPLVVDAGVDPCAIATWVAPDPAIQARFTRQDFNGTTYLCSPVIFRHGRVADATVDQVHASFVASIQTAEEVLGWSLTLPIRVHLYDSHDALVNGKRVEGGDERANARTYESVYGITTLLDNGMVGILLDTSNFPDPLDLRMLIAHEFAHIAQTGLMGNPNVLPFFVAEGGAEYFASLVVGADQWYLANRFWSAVADEQAGNVVPLRALIEKPGESDRRAMLASYSRGYAAMRYLAEVWGRDSFFLLHKQSVGGTPQTFVQNLVRLTGMSLDAFDRALSKWLLAQAPVS